MMTYTTKMRTYYKRLPEELSKQYDYFFMQHGLIPGRAEWALSQMLVDDKIDMGTLLDYYHNISQKVKEIKIASMKANRIGGDEAYKINRAILRDSGLPIDKDQK